MKDFLRETWPVALGIVLFAAIIVAGCCAVADQNHLRSICKKQHLVLVDGMCVVGTDPGDAP